ncbi:hypothetical protein Athai_11000 [Actinocatenispora thailandica]|uniref:Uncharacterized protein n=1 Tax=Actinocatenispora thailandica TaxID=227318 RepID=A0A7R7DL36_9ACTN|nr:hypothetical protein [Actinocatenispora thailandica]BCJ33597.1 hypothetical protein Athai_11000 [Actinocatenispora thailandica]
MTDDRKRLRRQRIRRVARFVLPLAAAELVSQLASAMGANLITESSLINSLLAVLFGVALSLLLEMRYRTRLDPDPDPDPDPDTATLTATTVATRVAEARAALATAEPDAGPAEPPPSPERRRLRGLNRRAVPVSGQLPEVPDLVGRESLCDEVKQQIEDGRVLVLYGAPNYGTSAVALSCARTYPAARTLYVDLRSGPQRPYTAQQVVDAVLAQLGKPDGSITEALRAEQLLLVLDNVQHDEQVAPFVSDTPPLGLTVIAGTGMSIRSIQPHVFTWEVAGLSDEDAIDLFGRETDRGDLSRNDNAKIIVRELGKQPTAIRLLAKNIEPDDRLSDWLPDTQVNDAVWRACWRTFELVHPVQLRLLRRMAAVAEVELDLAGIAALLRRPKGQSEVYELLRTLRHRQQIRQGYAIGSAAAGDDRSPEPRYLISDDWVPPLTGYVEWSRRSVRGEAQRALTRLLRHYGELAGRHADRLPESSAREWFGEYEATLVPLVTRWVPLTEPATAAAPRKAGPPGLTRGGVRAVTAIAVALCRWYEATGDYRGLGDSNRTARAYRVAHSVRLLADRYGEATGRVWALNQVAAIRRATGDQFGAQQRLHEAQRGPGRPRGGAQVSTNLSIAELGRDPTVALYRATKGRQLRHRSDHAGRGRADLALAVAYLHSGGDGRFSHRRQAEARLEAALREFGRAGDTRGEACVLHNLGLLSFDTAPHRAHQLFQEAHVRLLHGADPALAIQRALAEADLLCSYPAADRAPTITRLSETRDLAERSPDIDLVTQLDAYLAALGG